ncbi:glycosyltransferase family 9 protein [Kutzneria sp. NPDC052558]|uniref:glycosyltransferase family 9 protein n=1 Tax=Kutzneria sp. NPDC052558 TaxID=3364121 RepID=UPI0037C5EC82
MRPSVLALRALNLGDLLVAVPALRALRRHWPQHRLHLATSAWLAPVVELIGGVDQLVPANGLTALDGVESPDVAVNLHGAGPESNAVLDALAPRRRIGHRGHGWDGPMWTDDGHERQRWCRMLAAHGIPCDADDLLLRPPSTPSIAPGVVVIHPGAGYGSRRWPVERYAQVAARIGDRVVVTGTARERALASAVGVPDQDVLAGRLDLAQLAALIAEARLVISGDTGVAHLCYAYRTPSVVLFGPAPVEQWGPPADGPHRPLTVASARRGDPFADDPDPALLGVDVDAVLARAAELPATPPDRRRTNPRRQV